MRREEESEGETLTLSLKSPGRVRERFWRPFPYASKAVVSEERRISLDNSRSATVRL
jgi:hypothetical protein